MDERSICIIIVAIILVVLLVVSFIKHPNSPPFDIITGLFRKKDEYNYGMVIFIEHNENCDLVEKAIQVSGISSEKSFDQFNRVNRYDLDEGSGSYSLFLKTLGELFHSNGRDLHFYKDTKSKENPVFVIYDDE